MRNEMFEMLVNAKLDVFTSVWSDDFSAPKRDAERYASLLGSQTEFSDEEISAIAVELYNGTKTRQEVFG
jgi:hypothetical protein